MSRIYHFSKDDISKIYPFAKDKFACFLKILINYARMKIYFYENIKLKFGYS